MNDIKLLALLSDYYNAQKNVTDSMLRAMGYFEEGDYHGSWLQLFGWCEDKDRRDELWERFKHQCPRAVMLKEGVNYGRD